MLNFNRHCSGQASVVLILLAAIALIFFAATLNWGRVSQVKSQSTIAATSAVASMTSGIASYGENIIQTQLEGKLSKCTFSGWFKWLVIVGILIAMIACYGACAAFLAPFMTAIITSAVIAGAIAVVQLTVIQPGMSRAWNKDQASLPLADQFPEQGMASGAQGIVTDQAKVTDYFDMNTNAKFGAASGDMISRYGLFYTERLKALKKSLSSIDVTTFLDGLRVFQKELTEGCQNPDGTRSNDPHCDKCCVPLTVNGEPFRPADCPTAPVPAQCTANPPFIYDPAYPNYSSGGSFLATFGVDVEKKVFEDRQAEAKGIFSLFWDMDGMRNGPDIAKSKGSAVDKDYRRPDKVKVMDGFQAIFYPEPEEDKPPLPPVLLCADQKDPATGPWWRKGADKYCSATWPYDRCARETCSDSDCPVCTPATAADWVNDPMDDVVYKLKDFFAWAKQLLQQDDQALRADLLEWYPSAAFWVGPECDGSNDAICQKGGGLLYGLESRLTAWRVIFAAWLNSNEPGISTDYLVGYYHNKGMFTGINPYTFAQNNAWCMPKQSDPQYAQMTAAEIEAINTPVADDGLDPGRVVPSPPPWGSLNSVIQCLDWNSTNDLRFKKCKDDLEAIVCVPSTPPTLPASCVDLGPVDPCDPGTNTMIANLISDLQIFMANWRNKTCAGEPDIVACLAFAKLQADLMQAEINRLQTCSTELAALSCAASAGPSAQPDSCKELPRSLVCDPPPSPGEAQNCPVPAFDFDPCKPELSKYKKWADDSYTLSVPQVGTFKARSVHLKAIKDSVKDAEGTAAHGKMILDNFLYGTMLADGTIDPDKRPVPSLLDARKNFKQFLDNLPNFIIYGWQSSADPKNPAARMRWHMVRAEAQSPGKCPSGQCDNVANKMPWLYTYTHAWGTRKCYDLKDYKGRALLRLTRWDEDRQGTVNFNNKATVWNFRFGKPGVPAASASGLASCQISTGLGLGAAGTYIANSGTAKDKPLIRQAFMLNTIRSDPNNVIPAGCWNTVESLLSTANKTAACAAYDAAKGADGKYHMTVKFIPCPSGAFDDNKTLGNR